MRSLAVCLAFFIWLAGGCLTAGAPALDSAGKQSASASRPLSERACDLAEEVFARAGFVRYEHNKVPPGRQVTESTGGGLVVTTDCSGFVSYVLSRVAEDRLAPIQALEPGRFYPRASAFTRFFAGLDENSALCGWLKVDSVSQLRRGDLIAWSRPDAGKSGNTGHVAFVLRPPSHPFEMEVGGKILRLVSVDVIDSSSVHHFPPESLPPNAGQKSRDGLGMGAIRLVLDESGRPVGYWEGTYWGEGGLPIERPRLGARVALARLAD